MPGFLLDIMVENNRNIVHNKSKYKSDYKVISLDFQTISYGDFENEKKFVAAFSNEVLISEYDIPEGIRSDLSRMADGKERKDRKSTRLNSSH